MGELVVEDVILIIIMITIKTIKISKEPGCRRSPSPSQESSPPTVRQVSEKKWMIFLMISVMMLMISVMMVMIFMMRLMFTTISFRIERDIYDDLDLHHPQSDKKFGLKTSFWTHLQTDEGAEGDEVVDEDVWHPGLSVDTPSMVELR